MLIIIDNYDSFTYNLVQIFGELRQEVQVHRNDAITVNELANLDPKYLVVSPGPCSPDKAGISVEAIQHFAGKLPILGVCLGHQCIAQAFGGEIVQAKALMHGKVSSIEHDGKEIFSSLENPFRATRYHSLAVRQESLPECLAVSARTNDGEIMGLRHRSLPITGLQFHPESIATQYGHQLMQNFLSNGDSLS